MNLRTLSKPFTVIGTGLHSGKDASVTLKPSMGGIRTFIANDVKIPATLPYVVDTRRSTTLGNDGVTISTVEHILAALYLFGIDSCDIVVEGVEIPVLDGSAKVWVDKIKEAGAVEIDKSAPEQIKVSEPIYFVDDTAQFLVFNRTDDKMVAYYGISIPDTFINSMFSGGDIFSDKISESIVGARTYGLEKEVKELLSAGLALGGTLDNAVIIGENHYLNNDVKDSEPAWHKLLDLVGDLSLTGRRINATIIALRGGHRSHVRLAEKLLELT